MAPSRCGRTQAARRFRDLVEFVTADLGGAALLSEGQRQLIRRASALAIMCETIEADLARDLPFDLNNYLATTNTFRRVIETLGLKRIARPVNGDDEALLRHFSRPPPSAEADE
jgi:hypothetical protein